MKEFSFTEETARKFMRSQTLSRIPLIVCALLGGLYISSSRTGKSIFDNLYTLMATILITLISTFIGLHLGIKLGVKTLLQGKFVLTEDYIERHTASGKIVKINFDKISSHKIAKGGLALNSSEGKIFIPSAIDNFEELSKSVTAKLK